MSRTSESPHDSGIAAAKREMIDAFYHASPARVVEQHPLLSVTAVASASLAATVIALAPFSRKLVTTSAIKAVKSAMPLVQTFMMQRMQSQANSSAPQPPPQPDATHAMG
jgi:hypothetical protein